MPYKVRSKGRLLSLRRPSSDGALLASDPMIHFSDTKWIPFEFLPGQLSPPGDCDVEVQEISQGEFEDLVDYGEVLETAPTPKVVDEVKAKPKTGKSSKKSTSKR